MAGRPVRMLCRGQACTSGLNRLMWDGRSDGGLSVPSGAYLVVVEATGADGACSHAVTRIEAN